MPVRTSAEPSPAREGAELARPEPPLAFASPIALTREQLRCAPVRWPCPSRLARPLKPSGKRVAAGLANLGLETVGDLLEHLPVDSREARSVADLRAGEPATVAVQVRSIAARPVRRRGMRPLVEATVFDASASIRATFFNQPWLVERYPPGTRLLLHGKADARGRFGVSHHAPASAKLGEAAPDEPATRPGRPANPDGPSRPTGPASSASSDRPGRPAGPSSVAHYPASEGVTSTQILTLVHEARAELANVPEFLTAGVRVSERLPDRAAALAAMHFPRGPRDSEAARLRLAFDELLLTQLAFLRRREQRRELQDAQPLREPPSQSARWLAEQLPFSLTGDQCRALVAIDADLAQARAMQRLLMGEVGSGKTVVALYAMMRAVEHGAQAALMAPTETLAEQHFATLQRLLGSEPVRLELLTGSTRAARRRETLARLASGELSMIVGTHALIEPDVRFRSLAVAVVDEQHRFGVRQRAALAAGQGGLAAHTLHMTATPIPRTLALARYGDLDTSVLRELPVGRRPVVTKLVTEEGRRAEAYEHLREQLRAGRQAYVVCPLIEQAEEPEPQDAPPARASATAAGSAPARATAPARASAPAPITAPAPVTAPDGTSLKAATEELARLQKGELAGYELALLHGGMRPREKQQAMERFAAGEVQALVATTVIEVGIDVPNATVMVVENAERFGISQLHQLRGRIGRGEHPSCCFLVGPAGAARLRALATHSDGFRLADIDLELRKEGELIGTRQSGLSQLRVARLPQDAQLQERARAWAETLTCEDAALSAPEHALLATELERRFGELAPLPG